ncbi:hypothetical protein NQ318_016265 [Aromia moschata]|uniref:RRM domain-containing protein n=1 Tax=Aromia moschata TaxID=1265417 RepID=A0AAV8Y3H3_9CUCU|nr:hypothetical protein NQ318_016265 [Aromia moschata]
MCANKIKYLTECIKYQKILFSPLKKDGFVPESGSEVFVRNIPVEDTETDLLKFFETVGEIFQIRLMMEEDGINNRGFAYVTYINPAGAKRAVNILNNVAYQGKYFLQIEASLNNCRLFLGGIPTVKNKDQVWQELYKNGIKNIVDVIMYRSYTDRAENRGFVFVEFQTHEEAAYVRAKYAKTLRLWNNAVIVDWSVPIPPIDNEVLNTVKVIYLRNLDVSETPEEFQAKILNFTDRRNVEKVFKFKNYAFVHLRTRQQAEDMKMLLEG